MTKAILISAIVFFIFTKQSFLVLCACYALKLYLDGDLKQTYAVCGLALCSALAGPWVLLAIGAMFFFPYLNVKANNAAYEFCDSYTEE